MSGLKLKTSLELNRGTGKWVEKPLAQGQGSGGYGFWNID